MLPDPCTTLGGLIVLGFPFGLCGGPFLLNSSEQGVPLVCGEAFRPRSAPLHPATCSPVASNTSRWRVEVQAIPTCPLSCLVSGEADPVQFPIWNNALAIGKLDAAFSQGLSKLLDDV